MAACLHYLAAGSLLFVYLAEPWAEPLFPSLPQKTNSDISCFA